MRNSDPNLDLFSNSKRNPMPDEFEDISSSSYPGAEFRPPARDIPVWHTPMQSPGEKRKKKKTHRLRKAIVVLLCLLTVLTGSFYWYAYQTIDKIKRVPLDTNDLGISSDTYESVKNIALLGVDAREDVLKGRGDAILVLSINKSARRINLVSFARDSRVQIEGHGQQKLTHAFAFGRSQLMVKTLNQNYGLEITDYVAMNFFGLSRAIDAAGGVTISINKKEMDEMNTNIIPYMEKEMGIKCKPIRKTGKQHVTGSQAVSYARVRHIDSDLIRGNRQKEVMTALYETIRKSNPVKAVNIITEILKDCETSLPTKTILNTGIWLMVFQPKWRQTTIPNDDIPYREGLINGLWYFTYDLKDAQKFLQKFFLEK